MQYTFDVTVVEQDTGRERDLTDNEKSQLRHDAEFRQWLTTTEDDLGNEIQERLDQTVNHLMVVTKQLG